MATNLEPAGIGSNTVGVMNDRRREPQHLPGDFFERIAAGASGNRVVGKRGTHRHLGSPPMCAELSIQSIITASFVQDSSLYLSEMHALGGAAKGEDEQH